MIKPQFMDTHLIRTARYYEAVCLVHGKRKLLHFSKFNPLHRHPVNTGTFYDPLDVSINGVCDFTLRIFYLQHNDYKTKLNVLALRQRDGVL